MTTTDKPEMSPKPVDKIGHAIAKGTAYATFSTIMLRVVDAATAFVLLHALSVYGYGLYTLTFAAVNFWTFLFLPGLQNVIMSDAAAAKTSDHTTVRALFSVYAYFLMAVGIVLWAAFFFAGQHFAYWVDGHSEYLLLASFLFIFSPIETMFGLKAAILFDFGWITAYRSVRGIVRFLLLFGAMSLGILSIKEAVASTVVATGIAIAMTFFYRRESWLKKIGLKDLAIFWRHAVRTHGKWALAEDLFNSVTSSAQPFIIKYFLGAEAVALVTLASNLLSYAKSALPIRDVLFPILPQTEDKKELARYAGKVMKYATVAYCGITVLAAIGAPVVTHVVFPKYAPALELFYILLLSLPVFGIRSVAVPIFYTLKAQRALFFIIMSRTLLGLILSVLLIRFFGIHGAVISMLLVGLMTATSYFAEIKKRLPDLAFTWRDITRIDEVDKAIIKQAQSFISSRFKKILIFIH